MNKNKKCVKTKENPQDPRWYLQGDDAAKDAAMLGYTNATGETVDNAVLGGEVQYIPGIYTMYWAPAIGHYVSSSASTIWKTNPFNIAMKKIYANMRRKNTASPVYMPNDLGIYMMCIDSLFSFHATCVRLIKLATYFKNRNKYNAQDICQLHGIDYDDLAQNLADFRIWTNNFAKRINNALSVPSLPLFERHYWMNSHVWKDGDSVKSQLYMYIQYAFHKYNAAKNAQGGGTDIVPLFTQGSPVGSVADLKQIGDSLINALISDDDILLISADIDKWYGGNQFFLPTIGSDEIIEPEYSLEVLSQIQNTNYLNTVRFGELYQDVNNEYVYQDFSFATPRNAKGLVGFYDKSRVIVAPYDTPTPEQTLVMTRNSVLARNFTNATMGEVTLGSEAFIGSVVTFWPDINKTSTPTINNYPEYYDFSWDDYTSLTQAMLISSAFDMSPASLLFTELQGSEDFYGCFEEYENYTIISFDRLDQIHTMALYSEFGFYDTRNLSSRE